MNHQIPSVEDFLAQPDPAEDDYEAAMQEWRANPGMLHVLPPEPMERIVTALETLTELMIRHDQQRALMVAQVVSSDRNLEADGLLSEASESAEAVQTLTEEVADLRADRAELAEVIDRIEAALGKSKAAPALAAKAVIEAWRNPQVPAEPDEPSVTLHEVEPEELTQEQQEMNAAPVVLAQLEAEGHLPGHTRTPHPEGPDFCRECSGEQQEWVGWPCAPSLAYAAPVEPEDPVSQKPQQPEHNAPVEVWREYARALGYAGPEIDKANRSVIRTTLGIAQPGTD